MDRPLEGIRVLSMEQAAALPFATRHLADLGADVIRVQSHRRNALPAEGDSTRNKRQLAIDLGTAGGPEAFLRVAAGCDVVAHNFTPRVMRQFGIDYPGVRAVNEDVVYVSLTGFGTTGPWSERPLFGPGAEAVAGHNLLIGEEGYWTPGRPGTIVYADNTCGMYTAFAVLAALEERDATGAGQHIDISLYETAVSHLGGAVAERAFGAPPPGRVGNRDANFTVHGVFEALGHDRHVAISARAEQLEAVANALGIVSADEDALAAVIAQMQAEAVVAALQAEGVAAAVVADAGDLLSDTHLWARGFFGLLERGVPGLDGTYPHAGAPWGGGAEAPMREVHAVGQDTRDILRDVGGLGEAEIEELYAGGAAGELPHAPPRRSPADHETRIERGELSRVDARFDGWGQARQAAQR